MKLKTLIWIFVLLFLSLNVYAGIPKILFNESFDSSANWSLDTNNFCRINVSGNSLLNCTREGAGSKFALFSHKLPNLSINTDDWTLEFDVKIPSAASTHIGAILMTENISGTVTANEQYADLLFSGTNNVDIVFRGCEHSTEYALFAKDNTQHRLKYFFYRNSSISIYVNKTEKHNVKISSCFGNFTYLRFGYNGNQVSFNVVDNLTVYNGTNLDKINVLAKNLYDNTTINSFTAALFNSSSSTTKNITNGEAEFLDLGSGFYSLNLSSSENGGYFNKTYTNFTNYSGSGAISFTGELYQAIAIISAKRRGTQYNITSFNLSVPKQTNISNSSGQITMFLNASNYVASIYSTDYFDNILHLNLTNQSTSRWTAQFFDINVSISLYSVANNTYLKNFTVRLKGNDSDFSENLTADNIGNVTFSLGNSTYPITIIADRHSDFTANINLLSNNTFPNLTFSLIGLNSLNLSIFDEITRSLITQNTTIISFIGDTYSTNISTSTGIGYIQDLASGDYRIEYSSNGYKKRDYFLTIQNGTNTSVDLYLLSLGNSTDVIFQVKDESGNFLQDAKINLKRGYILSGNSYAYITVAMSKTNAEGKSILDVDYDDAFYQTLATYKNFLTNTIGSKIFDTTITIRIDTLSNPFAKIDNTNRILNNISFNNVTQTFSYFFSDPTGTTRIATLEITSNGVVVCSATSSSSSGTLLCQYNTTNSTSRVLATGYIDGSKIPIAVMEVANALQQQAKALFGRSGLFYTLIFAGSIAGLGLYSMAVAVIGFLAGLASMMFMGISFISITTYILFVIIGLFVVWRVKS